MRPELPRRLRAARALAGIDSVEELAERLNIAGLGATTLRKGERGERTIQPHELREIARVCNLPYEWFETGDLAAAVLYGDEKLRDPLGIPDEAAERLKRIEATIEEARLERKLDRLLQALGLEDEARDPAIAFAEAIEAAVRAPRGSQPGHDAAAGANDS